MLLNISNIQHFSVGDGDGIRTTVFFKGCNLRCPWCHNPEAISFEKTKLYYKNLNKTEVCGKEMTAEEVFREIAEDKDYYEESGGGVTFSGGEIMLQAQAALEIARLLRAEKISLFIDTAGCVPYSAFEKLNPYVDTYLFDFKTASSEKYAAIGGNLELVRSNIRQLMTDGKKVRIRIPLIPGFNTDEVSVKNMCAALREMQIESVDLLPFHRMGSGKYEAMGLVYVYKDTPPMGKKELGEIAEIYTQYFKVNVEH